MKKAQYFSFDAIIATMIMVIAFTSLVAYWFGVQAVIESRNNNLYADSLRMAESLLSQGSPSDWPKADMKDIRQIGLSNSNSFELNKTKIDALMRNDMAGSGAAGDNYVGIGNIMRASGNYSIVIQDMVDNSNYTIGENLPQTALSEVAIAHRGATLDKGGQLHPVSITVYLWRK